VGLRSKRVYECGGRFCCAGTPKAKILKARSELDKELGKHGREFAHLSVVLA
jgi:hypothetical protein